MKTACPNCFVCLAESEEQKDQLYWLCFALWYSKAFHIYLKGSVIEFLAIDDVNQCLSKSLLKSNQNKADFIAAIHQAKKFEELENLYEKNLQLIRQARRAIFFATWVTAIRRWFHNVCPASPSTRYVPWREPDHRHRLAIGGSEPPSHPPPLSHHQGRPWRIPNVH